ncbi:MAG: methyl-accepting chemotaxis protein [Bacteroidota bacterium]
MKRSILQQTRLTFAFFLLVFLVSLGMVIFFSVRGQDLSEAAQDRYLQSSLNLSAASLILQDATTEGFAVLATRNPVDQKQFMIDQQLFMNSFTRALDNSLHAYTTPEKQRWANELSEKFSTYIASLREAMVPGAVELPFIQNIQDMRRQLAQRLQTQLEAEQRLQEESAKSVQSTFGNILTAGIGSGSLLIFLFAIIYLAAFHKPIMSETKKIGQYVELLKSTNHIGGPLRLDSVSEFAPAVNMLGESFLALRLLLLKSRDITRQGHVSLDEMRDLFTQVHQEADAEVEKHREMSRLLDATLEATSQRENQVNTISQTIGETSSAITDIKKRLEALRDGINKISVSADENLHQLADIDEKTTKVSDSTSNVRKAISEISDSIKEMAESAEERNRSLGEMRALLQKVDDYVKGISESSEEIDAQESSRREIMKETKEDAEAMVEELHEIGLAVDGVSSRVNDLESKIQGINRVIERVNEISRKTDILALNAQVEAAKAKEKAKEGGEGFGVIADEIKSLAGEASKLTGDTGQIVEAIQSSIKEVKQSLEVSMAKIEKSQVQSSKTKEELGRTIAASESTAELVAKMKELISQANRYNEDAAKHVDSILGKTGQVTSALAEQSQAIARITSGVKELDEITTEVSDGTAEVKLVIERQIVESIKKISAEISEVAEAIAQQDEATDIADRAVKELKSSYEEGRQQQKRLKDAGETLMHLFEQEARSLDQLINTFKEVCKMSDSQARTLQALEAGTVYSVVQYHEPSI